LDFFNSKYGYISCNNGLILRTKDAGRSWDSTYSPEYIDLYVIKCVDSISIVTGGFPGKIFF
jgi:photosystem II stability/assembly factor-like uncharacterized protein